MAWFKTNNPKTGGGILTDNGRILAEILYAINQRQHMFGRAITVWAAWDKDGVPQTVGSYPAVTCFKGIKCTELRLWIEAARSAIETELLSYTSTDVKIYACDSSWNHYTFADLYNEAMGSGTDWADTLQGLDVDKTRPYEEMMKCLELIKRWEVEHPVTLGAQVIGCAVVEVTSTHDTTGGIMAAAVADGVVSYPLLAGAVLSNVDYGVGDKYDEYHGFFTVFKGETFPNSSPYPDNVSLTLGYKYWLWHDDLDWKLRSISAAEFTSPSWSGDGTQRDSKTFPGADGEAGFGVEVSGQSELYLSPVWASNGIFYLRWDGGTSNPFVADPNESRDTAKFQLTSATTRQIKNTGWTYG